MRRRALSLVVFNLLLALFASTTTATAETKPSCAACLDTSRAVDRALSKTRGDSSPMMSMGEDSQQQQRRGRSFPVFASEPEVAAALAEQTCNEVPRRHRQSCGSLLAAHSARLADFFLNASPSSSPSSPSSPSHRRQQQQRLPSCTEELCVVLSGACRPHEVSGEL